MVWITPLNKLQLIFNHRKSFRLLLNFNRILLYNLIH